MSQRILETSRLYADEELGPDTGPDSAKRVTVAPASFELDQDQWLKDYPDITAWVNQHRQFLNAAFSAVSTESDLLNNLLIISLKRQLNAACELICKLDHDNTAVLFKILQDHLASYYYAKSPEALTAAGVNFTAFLQQHPEIAEILAEGLPRLAQLAQEFQARVNHREQVQLLCSPLAVAVLAVKEFMLASARPEFSDQLKVVNTTNPALVGDIEMFNQQFKAVLYRYDFQGFCLNKFFDFPDTDELNTALDSLADKMSRYWHIAQLEMMSWLQEDVFVTANFTHAQQTALLTSMQQRYAEFQQSKLNKTATLDWLVSTMYGFTGKQYVAISKMAEELHQELLKVNSSDALLAGIVLRHLEQPALAAVKQKIGNEYQEWAGNKRIKELPDGTKHEHQIGVSFEEWFRDQLALWIDLSLETNVPEMDKSDIIGGAKLYPAQFLLGAVVSNDGGKLDAFFALNPTVAKFLANNIQQLTALAKGWQQACTPDSTPTAPREIKRKQPAPVGMGTFFQAHSSATVAGQVANDTNKVRKVGDQQPAKRVQIAKQPVGPVAHK